MFSYMGKCSVVWVGGEGNKERRKNGRKRKGRGKNSGEKAKKAKRKKRGNVGRLKGEKKKREKKE